MPRIGWRISGILLCNEQARGEATSIEKPKTPRYAAGQELTLHPGDPVRGADLLEQNLREESGDESPDEAAEQTDRVPDRF